MSRIVISCSVLLVCICAALAINAGGISARHFEKSDNHGHPTIYLVKNTSDVYRLWETKKVHGRVIVHLGKFLHYVQPNFDPDYTALKSNYPVVLKPHEFKITEVSFSNFLWTAMHTGIARKIFNVIPPDDFRQRFNLEKTKAPADVVENDYASSRVITTRLPSLHEPVLLNLDASYFGKADISRLEDLLRTTGLTADIVTVCLAEDSPDVNEQERIKAREFIGRMTGFADIVEPGSSI